VESQSLDSSFNDAFNLQRNILYSLTLQGILFNQDTLDNEMDIKKKLRKNMRGVLTSFVSTYLTS
jgi:hypothetical protein